MKEILRIEKPTVAAVAPKSGAPMIEFKGVSKVYGSRAAIRDITITIGEGEFVSLVGQSGVGKTTLIKLLTKQEMPSTGQLFVAGRNLADLRPSEVPIYRRKIGVVFQDFKLLPQKTVWENVAFALEVCGFSASEITRRTERVLDLVNMNRRAKNYPHELSGGERQRAAIARALVHSPKILIADEPTGNLDPVNTLEILELLNRINQKGTTVILATHNRQAVDRIQRRVVLMKGGKIAQDEEAGRYVI